MREQPFTWIPGQHGSDSPPRIVGRETQLIYNTTHDPANYWVYGNIVSHEDDHRSLGRNLWHRGRYVCLLCGARADVTGRSDEYLAHYNQNHHVTTTDNLCGSGARASGYEEGRETIKIPLCIHYSLACEDDDDAATLLGKAVESIDARPATSGTMNQTPFGGDSSMDMKPSSPIPSFDEDGGGATGISSTDSILPGETIARLHIRRSKQDPRFAELEGVIPLDSTMQMQMQISMDPFLSHTYKQTHALQRPPIPMRRPLPWLRSRNQQKEDKERPASILDAHFVPCCIGNTGPSHVGVYGISQGEEPVITETQIKPGVECLGQLVTVNVGAQFHLHKIPGIDPPQSSSYSTHLLQNQNRELPEFSTSSHKAQDNTAAETRLSPLPKEERALAPANETPKLLPPTPLGGQDKRRSSSTDSDIDIDIDTTNTNWSDFDTEQNKDQIPSKKAEGKGKSVAWDSTVARGETESDPDPDPGSESSHESYEREPADYYAAQRDPARGGGGGGGDPRKRRTLTSPARNETPAQSKEFIDLLYPPNEPDKREETRLASLAMPGRRRGMYVGRGKGGGLFAVWTSRIRGQRLG